MPIMLLMLIPLLNICPIHPQMAVRHLSLTHLQVSPLGVVAGLLLCFHPLLQDKEARVSILVRKGFAKLKAKNQRFVIEQ